jgi:hypothetical protein
MRPDQVEPVVFAPVLDLDVPAQALMEHAAAQPVHAVQKGGVKPGFAGAADRDAGHGVSLVW